MIYIFGLLILSDQQSDPIPVKQNKKNMDGWLDGKIKYDKDKLQILILQKPIQENLWHFLLI